MNHYPHHLGDYAKDTMHLSPLEHGVYRLLMDAYYATEKPLPLDIDAVCRMARCVNKTEKLAVGSVLNSFFETRQDGFHQKRIDEEIAEYKIKADKNRENGQLGGRPPNPNKTHSVISGLANVEPNGNPNITLTSNQEPINIHKPRKSPRSPLPAGFALSDRVRNWGAAKGYTDQALTQHFEFFVLTASAGGYAYSNWDSALIKAIQGDWAKVGKGRSVERKLAQ